jgi:hypothetical protein
MLCILTWWNNTEVLRQKMQFEVIHLTKHHAWVVSILTSNSGDTRIKSQSEDWLHWQVFVIFLSFSWQMPE